MALTITLHFIVICFGTIALAIFAQDSNQFTYNGFKEAKLYLDGIATVHPNGLLQLTNFSQQLTSHAFHPNPLKFSSSSSLSFSTSFAFAIYPEREAISGVGIMFVLSPSLDLHHGAAGKYFGVFNSSSNGNFSNHVLAVELDTIQDIEFSDIDSNHVGIDVNGLVSNASASAAYFSDSEQRNKSLKLTSAKPMQTWIDYDEKTLLLQVTIAPLGLPKPPKPLLSSKVNLSEVFLDTMYVGFSSSTLLLPSSHYILGWSFRQGEQKAPNLDISKLPPLPRFRNRRRVLTRGSITLLVIIPPTAVMIALVFYVIRRKKYKEVIEDWEHEYVLQRYSYKDLFKATKGFKDKELLGAGGFGKVYRGVLSSQKLEVAVKRVLHGSHQGKREFIAEIASLGRLRHRNLVPLLGYCRRKREFLLVYHYMPNGSLDRYLHNHEKTNLSWNLRLKIIQGVASALVYLHEEWEQVVVHRDIKTSNVLLDADMNARLGDFGLARLYDHGSDPQTTHVVGTVGYLAPELTRKGKTDTSTDVFSFGVVVLEVACGRRPISLHGSYGEMHLIDWVHECWMKGVIIEARDPKFDSDFVEEEVEMVLQLGMQCCHPKPEARPNMRQVMQVLNGDSALPEMLPPDAKATLFTHDNQVLNSFPVSSRRASYSACSSDSILEVGR